MLLIFMTCVISTTLASVAHGRDWLSKWLIAGVQLAAILAALWLTHWNFTVSVVAVAAWLSWWLMLRDGNNAHASLSYLQDAPWKDSDDVWQVFVLPAIIYSIGIIIGVAHNANIWALAAIPGMALGVWGIYLLTKKAQMKHGYTEAQARMRVEFAEGVFGGMLIASEIFAWSV